MNDQGPHPDNRWLTPPPTGGLLRGNVRLEPIVVAAPKPFAHKQSMGRRRPLLLTLACAGVLVGLSVMLLGTGRQQPSAMPERAPLAASQPMPPPVPAVQEDPAEVLPQAAVATPPAMSVAAVALPEVAPAPLPSSEPLIQPAPVAPAVAPVVAVEPLPVVVASVPMPVAPAVEPMPPTASAGPEPAVFPLTAEEAKRSQLAWAKHLKQPAVATNQIDMKLVLLPPGELLMGSPRSEIGREENEGPQRNVRLSAPCYIGAHEVTVGQFARFAKAIGYQAEALKPREDEDDDDDRGRGRGRSKRGFPGAAAAKSSVPDDAWYHARYAPSPAFPVVQVTWADAVAFCDWLSESEGRRYRLPTEAEWEFACRAGSLASTSWGEVPREHAKYGWFRENSGGRTRAVGELRANVWGLYDMHGNVAEWCGDWMAEYGSAEEVDPRGPADGGERVLRGGAWDASRLGQRSAWRGAARPGEHFDRVGFRVVCEIDPAKLAAEVMP